MANVYTFMKREVDAGVPMNLKKTQKKVAEATVASEMSLKSQPTPGL